MNKTISLVAMALVLFAAGCKDQGFKKTKEGGEYKLFKNDEGQKAVAGDFIELNILAKYKDSVLLSTIESSTPRFFPYDTASLPVFFKQINEGDSLIIRQSTDSIIKAGQGAPWMTKGQYIYQYFKVVKIFKSKEAVDSVAKAFEAVAKVKAYKTTTDKIAKELADSAELMKKDDKIISDFMAKNNLKGNKTGWGTYVVITTPGTGPNLSNNDVAVINYTGKTFNDSTFDSNTDKKFGHVEPLYVDMGEFRVIPGWIDGLKMMQKGSKGKIIIPSILAYGKNGSPPRIGPNENLIFDIEVTDIVSQDEYQKQMEAQQMEMRMKQQQMMQEQMKKQQEKQQNTPAPNGK